MLEEAGVDSGVTTLCADGVLLTVESLTTELLCTAAPLSTLITELLEAGGTESSA